MDEMTDGLGIAEDYCRCGHVASHHAGGDGECRTCKVEGRRNWALLARCHHFIWAETWETTWEAGRRTA